MDTLFQRGVDGIQVVEALLIFACLCHGAAHQGFVWCAGCHDDMIRTGTS